MDKIIFFSDTITRETTKSKTKSLRNRDKPFQIGINRVKIFLGVC